MDLLGPMVAIMVAPCVMGVFIVYVCFLQAALDTCSPQNQVMRPGLVWLMVIPFFGLIWQFFALRTLSTSLDNEYRSLGFHGSPVRLKSLGTAKAIVDAIALPHVVTAALLFFPTAPEGAAPAGALVNSLYVYCFLASIPLTLASLFLWTIHWSRARRALNDLSRHIGLESRGQFQEKWTS